MTVKIPVRLQPVRVRRENDIQREVLEALRKMGKFCLRLQSGKVKVKGGWMQLCPEGTPDILVLNPLSKYRHVIWIEMKRIDPQSKQAAAQERFALAAVERGEMYAVCRSLDDALKAIREEV